MKKAAIPLFIALFSLAFLVQRWLELQHLVDSIGLWYTIMCALFHCAVVFGVVLGVNKLFRRK
jgi:hypothetical protein